MKTDNDKIKFDDDRSPVTILDNRILESFNELEVLGIYAYVRMLLEQEITTLVTIIDKLIEKFNVDHDFLMYVFKKFKTAGVFTIMKTTE